MPAYSVVSFSARFKPVYGKALGERRLEKTQISLNWFQLTLTNSSSLKITAALYPYSLGLCKKLGGEYLILGHLSASLSIRK